MKTLIILLYVVCLTAVSIVQMIYGWGIQPKNWGWICFGYLFSMLPLFASLNKKSQ